MFLILSMRSTYLLYAAYTRFLSFGLCFQLYIYKLSLAFSWVYDVVYYDSLSRYPLEHLSTITNYNPSRREFHDGTYIGNILISRIHLSDTVSSLNLLFAIQVRG